MVPARRIGALSASLRRRAGAGGERAGPDLGDGALERDLPRIGHAGGAGLRDGAARSDSGSLPSKVGLASSSMISVPVGEPLPIRIAVPLDHGRGFDNRRRRLPAACRGSAQSCAASAPPRPAPRCSASKTAAIAAIDASSFRRRTPNRLFGRKAHRHPLVQPADRPSTSSSGSAAGAGNALISSSNRNFLTSSAAAGCGAVSNSASFSCAILIGSW